MGPRYARETVNRSYFYQRYTLRRMQSPSQSLNHEPSESKGGVGGTLQYNLSFSTFVDTLKDTASTC